MTTAKSFDIPKRLVWEAYKHVKANGGAAGVDEQSLTEFEEELGNNLYRIWNRMASGSYFPPPGQGRRDCEEVGRRADARDSHRLGSYCADGGEECSGASDRSSIP